MRHVPDDLETDEAGEHEDDEMRHEACRREETGEQDQRPADDQQADLLLRLRLEGGSFRRALSSGVSSLAFSFGFCAAIAWIFGGGGGKVYLTLIGDGRTADHVVFHIGRSAPSFFGVRSVIMWRILVE